MDELTSAPSPPIRVRTPHLKALVATLEARDHRFDVLAADLVRVHDVAADDLGWLVAGAGVVIYEMTGDPDPDPAGRRCGATAASAD